MSGTREKASFRLLFVCTANICRSPIAAELARLRIRAAPPPAAEGLVVGSAGIHGRDGAAMDPRAAAVLESLGGCTAGFSARALTASLVARADLVLTAERRQATAAVALHPRSHPKVFTVREFTRLTGGVGPGRLPDGCGRGRARALVEEAARLRGALPAGPGDEDIADPYPGPTALFHECAEAIRGALERPLGLILDR